MYLILYKEFIFQIKNRMCFFYSFKLVAFAQFKIIKYKDIIINKKY